MSKLFEDEFKNVLIFNKVEYNGRCLKFKSPYSISLYVVDGVIFCDNKDFKFYTCCNSIEEMEELFQRSVMVDWFVYVDCEEEDLSKNAIEYRNFLINKLDRIN